MQMDPRARSNLHIYAHTERRKETTNNNKIKRLCIVERVREREDEGGGQTQQYTGTWVSSWLFTWGRLSNRLVTKPGQTCASHECVQRECKRERTGNESMERMLVSTFTKIKKKRKRKEKERRRRRRRSTLLCIRCVFVCVLVLFFSALVKWLARL